MFPLPDRPFKIGPTHFFMISELKKYLFLYNTHLNFKDFLKYQNCKQRIHYTEIHLIMMINIVYIFSCLQIIHL